MRLRPAPEPYAVSADWSRRTAGFALLLALIAVVAGRGGVADGWGGVAVLGAALALALAALGFTAKAMAVIWRTGRRGMGRALAGALTALLVWAYPAYLLTRAWSLPALADISTDLASPPAFSPSAAALAARHGARHEEPSPEARDLQRRAYPEIQPILLDLDAASAFRAVLKALAARRWTVIEASAPIGRFGVGHIDAVASSRVMGFPEDVAIRVRPQDGRTRLDVRSASRIERHDVGGNAARIESLADDLGAAE